MQNEKISNQKVEVPSTSEMNDCDYLNAILEIEKNMSVNMAIALNEASNENLYQKLYEIFKNIKDCQRNLYELSFQKGWYSLEKENQQKIGMKYNELNQKLQDLSK